MIVGLILKFNSWTIQLGPDALDSDPEISAQVIKELSKPKKKNRRKRRKKPTKEHEVIHYV